MLPVALSWRATKSNLLIDGAKFMSAGQLERFAARVFGDEEKAQNWLHRPNASLSGQKPIDLLKDELGAAVVREALEQIDHGMFA
jgi:putative toxin-antitoxin system antitoxin component (TIGR02293 family)